MNGALVIAIVGAESTGKTALAQALAQRVAAETGLQATWVPEALRLWCDRMGRTPLQHEQAGIAALQQHAIEKAAASHEVVVADTAPLVIATYSRQIFGDASLVGAAAEWHARSCALTLLTAVDLPWVADGMRDGPHAQGPTDSILRELLTVHRLPWALVGGQGAERLENALDAVAPLLRRRAAPGRGLFTRLSERNAQDKPWSCELCDDPACEHRVAASRR